MAKKEVVKEVLKKETTKKAASKKETVKKAEPKKAAPKKAVKKTDPKVERTRVISAKITIIEQVSPEEATRKVTKKEKMELMSAIIKKALKADDVQVINVQDFLLEK